MKVGLTWENKVRKVLPASVKVTITLLDVAGIREMPWYAKALSLSRPLHFGDYGGLLLKIIWFGIVKGAVLLELIPFILVSLLIAAALQALVEALEVWR